jgi:hypothetical protein
MNILHTIKGIKNSCLDFSHLAWELSCNTLKERQKRLEDEEEEVSSYCKIMEFEGRRTRSHCVENKVCKKLWTCRKKISCW